MEKERTSNSRIWIRLSAGLLALVFVLSMYLTLRAQIRFSGLNFIGQVSEYAARVTEDNTGYLSQSTLDRAWTILRATVRRPRTYSDYEMYSSLAIAREDYAAAIPYLQGCIDTYDGGDDAELAVLYLRLASLHVLEKDYDGALPLLDTATGLDPTLAAAYFLRAEMRLTTGDSAGAVEDLGTYRTLDGSDPLILVSLADLYESTGDYKAAVECYTAGITDEKVYSVDMLAGRARCYVLLGEMDRAETDLETYFSRNGTDPDGEAAAMLAVCRMNREDYSGACEMFHRAIRDGYANPYILYGQSVLCAYMSGDYPLAVQDGEKAIQGAEEQGEDSAELHFWVGLAHLVMQEYPQAGEHFSRAAEQNGSLKDLSYYRGVSALAQEETEEAIGHFTRSVELGESLTASLYDRAICYLALERYEEAKADLLQVIERNDDPSLTAQAQELMTLL